MYMTPTRYVVNDMIALSVLVENYFEEVRPQLVTEFTNWENQYSEYARKIEEYMEYFTKLDSSKYVWSLVPRDIGVLCKAWFRINILINYFADFGKPIPDDLFVHTDLTDAGINYIDIYGSDGDLSEDATVTKGKFTQLVSGEKRYTFSLGTALSEYSSSFAKYYLYQMNMNDDKQLNNDDYQPGIIENTPVYSNYVPYGAVYKRLYPDTRIFASIWNKWHTAHQWKKVADEVTNQAQVDALIEEYGSLYHYDPNKWNYYVKFGDRVEEIITDKRGVAHFHWEKVESYISGIEYGYMYSPGEYVVFDSSLQPHSQAEFEALQEIYGDIYKKFYDPITDFKDAYIYNAYDLMIREILPLVDAFQVKCKDCGTVGMMKIHETIDPKRIVFRCPTCGNYNPEHMTWPLVYYVGLTHPLFTYDPDFNWYEEYAKTQTIRKQLICKNLWKGKFGTGSKYTMTDLDYLPKVETIGYKEWDKKATTLAKTFLEYIKDFNLQLTLEGMKTITYKLTTDATFQVGKTYYTRSGTGTSGDPYVYTKAVVTAGSTVTPGTYYECDSKDIYLKLYQLGNVFAIRHEIIRVCYAVLKRLLDEGAGVKI